MHLIGDKIYLREVRFSDLNQTYVDWLNDPEVNQFLETRFEVQSLQSITNYFQSHICKKDEPWWAIIRNEEIKVVTGLEGLDKIAKHIGNIKLGPINWHHQRAEISIFIGDKSQWGKGYGAEAIKLVTEYAFNQLNLLKVSAGIYDENIASQKVFANSGFKKEGELKSHVYINSRYQDLILMGRFRFDIK